MPVPDPFEAQDPGRVSTEGNRVLLKVGLAKAVGWETIFPTMNDSQARIDCSIQLLAAVRTAKGILPLYEGRMAILVI